MLSFITVTLFYVKGSCLWFEIIGYSKELIHYVLALHSSYDEGTISYLEERLRKKLVCVGQVLEN